MMMSKFWGLTVTEGQKEEIRIVNGEIVLSCCGSLQIHGGGGQSQCLEA